MVSGNTLNEIHQRLYRIRELAAEIEAVPNLPQDVWTMKGIDKKCREIQAHCQWISTALGTGDGGFPGTGPG